MFSNWKRKKQNRASDPSLSWDYLSSQAGLLSNIASRQAENLSTVSACVSLISSSIASLPAYVYQETDKGRFIQTRHALARLIKAGVNENQTWVNWLESMMASTLLKGNGLSIIERNERSELLALRFVPWGNVQVRVLSNGRIAYDVTNDSTYGRLWPSGRFFAGDVLHLRDRSDNSIIGVSRLSRAAQVLEMGLTVNDFAQQWFQQGMNPSGILESDNNLNPETIKTLQSQFQTAHAGAARAGKMMILTSGLKWKAQSSNAEDGELLPSRKFTTEEICRIFQVSPIMVADLSHGTFTNSIEMFRQFVRLCLAGWIEKIKAEFCRSVFAGDEVFSHSLDLDLSSFMKADDLARWQSHKIAVEGKILTTNEVREVEGWNTLPIAGMFPEG